MNSLVDNGDGTWTFTAAENDDGQFNFTYTVSDGESSVVGTAVLDINSVNDAPTTTPVTLAAIAEDSGVRLITQAELLANASDVDGPALTAVGLAIGIGNGSLADNGDGTWNYTPAENDDSSVMFIYDVTDGQLTTVGSATLDITPVNDAPQGAVVIQGVAAENLTLTADTSGVIEADGIGAVSYQWLRDGVPIVGADAVNYVLVAADVGAHISVQVGYTDAGGTPESLTSAETDAVNDAPNGTVLLTNATSAGRGLGAAEQGDVLQVGDTLSDADGMGAVTYHWLRNGVDTGATGSTYNLMQADVGQAVSVRAIYVDGLGKNEQALSDATSPIVDVSSTVHPLIYFQAETYSVGSRLWVTDGTAAGTRLVSSDGQPYGNLELTTLPDGRVLYRGWTSEAGGELWVSDGTPAGTYLLKDIAPGGSNSFPTTFAPMSNGLVLFLADDRTSGHELWVTDGTPAGTQLLKEISPGPIKHLRFAVRRVVQRQDVVHGPRSYPWPGVVGNGWYVRGYATPERHSHRGQFVFTLWNYRATRWQGCFHRNGWKRG
jgi:ELWxxDGT repeat protein